jgi:Glutathione S-transferase
MISVYLEFLKVPYEVTTFQLFNSETKADWYAKINPNGRIPAIVDPNTNITLSQTGAILQYLAENYDKDFKYSYKPGTPEYYLEKELLFLEVTENGPTHVQAVHYNLLNKGASEYAATRILNEIKRIYGVAEQYLIKNPSGLFFVGDHYSTADVAFYFWVEFSSKLDIDLSVWPNLAKWAETFGAIEEVKVGSQKPPRTY